MDRVLQDMPTLSSGFSQMTRFIVSTHSLAEMNILRQRRAYTSDMKTKLIRNVMEFARILASRPPFAPFERGRICATPLYFAMH